MKIIIGNQSHLVNDEAPIRPVSGGTVPELWLDGVAGEFGIVLRPC